MKRKVPGMGIRNGQGSCAAGGETQMEESVKRRAGKRNGGARRTGRLLSCAALLMILTGAVMLSVGLFRITAQMMGAVDALRISPLLYDLAACGMSADGLLLMRTGRKTLIDPFGEDRMVLGFPWSAWLVAFTAAAQAVVRVAGGLYGCGAGCGPYVCDRDPGEYPGSPHRDRAGADSADGILSAEGRGGPVGDGSGRPAVRPGGEEAEGADHSTERTAE